MRRYKATTGIYRHGRQEKEFYEVIFQVGNMDDTPVGSEAAKTATEILQEFTEGFIKRNPHLRVFNAVIHLDEATPHVHIDFVPFATGQKRGLSTRNTLSKALEQQGFKGESKLETNTKKWIEREKAALAEVMLTRVHFGSCFVCAPRARFWQLPNGFLPLNGNSSERTTSTSPSLTTRSRSVRKSLQPLRARHTAQNMFCTSANR